MRIGRYNLTCLFLLAALIAPVTQSRAQVQGTEKDLVEVAERLQLPVREAPADDKVALLIGVKEYGKASPLQYTVRDAKLVGEFLEEEWKFPPDRISYLTDGSAVGQQPTGNTLKSRIRSLLGSITRRRTEVVVYFSGHGVRWGDEDWLVPNDFGGDITQDCVSATKLIQAIEAAEPKRALLIFDACRNVPTTTRSLEGFGGSASRRPEIAVMYSCEENERSHEVEEFKQGLFTYYLLAGLRGESKALEAAGLVSRRPGAGATPAANPRVTAGSLMRYVRNAVLTYTRDRFRGVEQKPFLKTQYPGMCLTALAPPEPPPVPVAVRVQDLISEAYQAFEAKQHGEVAAKAAEVLKLDPANPYAHLLLGRALYLTDGDLDDAIKHFNEALRLNPSLLGAEEARKEVLAKKGKRSSATLAQEARDHVATNLDLAEAKANEAIGLDGENALAHLVLGRVYHIRRELDNATREYQTVLDLKSPLAKEALEGLARIVEERGERVVASLVLEAQQALESGRFDEAERKAREALSRRPEHAAAGYVLGRVLHQRERLEEAVAQYEKALRSDPTLVAAKDALATARQEIASRQTVTLARQAYEDALGNRIPEAYAKAQEVTKRGTTNRLALALTAYVYGRHHEAARAFNEAIQAYQKSLELEPGLADAREGLSRAVVALGEVDHQKLVAEAEALLAQKKLDLAEQKIREALVRKPRFAKSHLVLARVLAERGHVELALREYEEARRLDASLDVQAEIDSLQRRQRVLAAAAATEEAYRDLTNLHELQAASRARTAVELDPQNVRAHAVLGIALLLLGDEAAARVPIAEATRLDAAGKEPLVYVARSNQLVTTLQPRRSEELLHQPEELLKTAVRLDPSNYLAVNDLGALYFELSRINIGRLVEDSKKRALSEAERKQLAASERKLLTEAEWKRTLAAGKKWLAEAEKAFGAAIKLRPDFPSPYWNLGSVHLQRLQVATDEREKREHARAAVESLQEAVRLSPQNAGFHAALGWALLRSGDAERARREIAEARKLGLAAHWAYDEVDGKKPVTQSPRPSGRGRVILGSELGRSLPPI